MNRRYCLAAVAFAAVAMFPAPVLADPLMDQVRAYRVTHARQIIDEFVSLLSEPNDASSIAAIEHNAETLAAMLKRRGFATRILSAGAGTPPAVYADIQGSPLRKTVLFYAHFDGQPVSQPDWWSPPFQPVMRVSAARSASLVDWQRAPDLNDEWRIFARSTGDDKASIIALLAAYDALRASGHRPSINVKILFEGEEEKSSPHLAAILHANRPLLKADLMVLGDGPISPTGNAQVVFGARGFTSVELTAYGPSRPLHDGHYGNWAPNPAVMLMKLLSGARDENGKIALPHFNDDVRPLSPEETQALVDEPPIEDELKKELALGRTELDPRLSVSVSRPALNIRGFAAGAVGPAAANAIPSRAEASLDFRLVPDQKPERIRQEFEDFARSLGWFVTSDEPNVRMLLAHPKVLKETWTDGYPAYRADMSSAVARLVSAAVERGMSRKPIKIPLLGGSVPMSLFSDELGIPVICVPIANYDDNQHAANENIRLGNLWSGIQIYAALLSMNSR